MVEKYREIGDRENPERPEYECTSIGQNARKSKPMHTLLVLRGVTHRSRMLGRMPETFFVMGADRSAIRTFADATTLLGATRAQKIPASDRFNRREYLEFNPIVQANEAILEAMLRRWNDSRPVVIPEEQNRTRIIADFESLLKTAFVSGTIKVLDDPRVSILAPLWLEAGKRVGAKPVLAIMLRDPVASATSLMRRDGLTAEAAIALWLRYMLDAELHSRRQARVIFQLDDLIADPISTLASIGAELDVAWSIDPADVGDALRDLVDCSMLDPASNVDTPLLELANQVCAVMRENAQGPAAESHAQIRLDRIRADFDARCEAIHARMVFDQLGKAVQRKWQIDAKRKSQTQAQPVLIDRMKAAERREVDLQPAVAALQRERDAAIEKALDAQTDLAYARRQPFALAKELLTYKVLTALCKSAPFLPSQVAQRFARSAAKRDPNRSLALAKSDVAIKPHDSAFPIEVSSFASCYAGAAEWHAGRQNVLVVSHDASWTGAPILALNLVQELSSRYNVVTLCLRGGTLFNAFRRHSVSVWKVHQPTGGIDSYSRILDRVIGTDAFTFAIVNSIESRHTLSPLKSLNIPTIALFHEFASYTNPTTAFRDAISQASYSIFSTFLTLENAIETTEMTRNPSMQILPQGKCRIPALGISQNGRRAEKKRLMKLLRPKNASPDRFIVVGAGYVQIRKGVDLFIDVAMRVLNRPGGQKAQFFWFGSGFNPEKDIAYSAYLQDQLKRSGLIGRVVFFPETQEIETVYKHANALALTSRLDPLPNVAIDAMCAGLPVLCFDHSTGIAEFLAEAGLKDRCVARYLDTGDMAEKIAVLAESPKLHADVSDIVRAYAASAFDFSAYTRQLEHLALSCK